MNITPSIACVDLPKGIITNVIESTPRKDMERIHDKNLDDMAMKEKTVDRELVYEVAINKKLKYSSDG